MPSVESWNSTTETHLLLTTPPYWLIWAEIDCTLHVALPKSWVFLLRQLIFWQFFVNYSTVDCKYLFFLQDFFYRLKPKQYKKCQYSWLFKKKHLETCKTKQTKCRIFWQETVRKLIDGLERLGYKNLICTWVKIFSQLI